MSDGFETIRRIEQGQLLRALRGGDEVGGGPAAGGATAGGSRGGTARCPTLFDPVPCVEEESLSFQLGVGTVVDPPSQDEVQRQLREQVRRISEAATAGNPVSNTGFKFTVHGSSISVWAPLNEVAELLCSSTIETFCFDSNWEEYFALLGSANFYNFRYGGPHNCTLKTGAKMGEDHCSIELPGEWFEALGNAAFARIIGAMHERGWRWHLTRVDFAFDGVPFTPRQAYHALLRGKVRSLSEHDSAEWHENREGKTCNFGKRSSADYLRIYDRRETGVRCEHECKKLRSKLAGLALVTTPIESWHNIALMFLRDFLDFVDVKPGENVTRCTKLLPWWRALIGEVERMKISASCVASGFRQRAEETVLKLVSYAKAVQRRLFVLQGVLGEYGARALFQRLSGRISERDHVRVATYRSVLSRFSDAWEGTADKVFSRLLPPGDDFPLRSIMLRYNPPDAC
jgi:hypothetical protein